jgi:hypothetical protein
MAMSESEVSFEMEFPELDGLPPVLKKDILNEIGDYLKVSILDYVGQSESPVEGGEFQVKLSEEYAKREGKDEANLDQTGSMLDSLVYKVVGNSVKIGIFAKKQTPKAYNHNVGDTLPQRQFIPESDQVFKKDIMRGIDEVIADLLGG